MTSSVEHAEPISSPTPDLTSAIDLRSAIHQVLSASNEPLTVSKIRAALPSPLRQVAVEELNDVLRQEAVANKLYEYPKYRSQQERYWDRPMAEHIVYLLTSALEEKPLAWADLRRKLPAYAQGQAMEVLEVQIQEQRFHRHPRQPGKRTGEPFGIRPADPKDYLQQELSDMFIRLESMGFTNSQIRAAALETLHDEEWAPTPPEPRRKKEPESAAPAYAGSSGDHDKPATPDQTAPALGHGHAHAQPTSEGAASHTTS